MEQRLLPLSGAVLALGLGVGCAHGTPPRPAGTPYESAQAETGARSDSASGKGAAVAAQSFAGQTTSGADGDEEVTTRARQSDTRASELPRGTLVLHVGDSFAGALGVPLGKRLKAAGLRSVLEFRTSTYVPTWASGTELPGYVARYNPDLVIVTLGANEFDLQNPEQRAGSVRRLVRELGGRPCVWVTPPRWKQDSGILSVIHDNVKPCRFLDSDTVVHELERKRDGIHPTDAAREIWADAVVAWLEHERRGGSARPWELREEQR